MTALFGSAVYPILGGAGSGSGGGSGGGGGLSEAQVREIALNGAVRPESYGARPNVLDFDNTPAFQTMFSDIASRPSGGKVELIPDARYCFADTLFIDPSATLIEGNAAKLDFRLKSFILPGSLPEQVTDAGFDGNGSSWPRSAASANTITFSGGVASAPAVKGETGNLYSEFGQRLPLVVGKPYTIRVKIKSITQVTSNSGNTSRAVNVRLTPNGVGQGNSGTTLKSLSNADPEYVEGVGGVWEYQVTNTMRTPFLTISSSAGFEIEEISVKDAVNNYCLVLRHTKNGHARGHNEREMRNIKIRGAATGAQARLCDGVLFDTPNDPATGAADGNSRVNFYNWDISDNVGRGLVFGNNAFLMNFHSCRITCAVSGIDTIEGALNAGENIAFFGGNFGGGDCGITLRGMNVRTFGTSIDFSRQWYRGKGRLEMHGPHLESKQFDADDAAKADFADNQWRFDVQGGYCEIFGGYIHCGGTPNENVHAEAMVRVAKGARFSMEMTRCFNWLGYSQAWAVGEGHVELDKIEHDSNGAVPLVIKRDVLHNRFGPAGSFDLPRLGVNAWTEGGTRQIDRQTVSFGVQRVKQMTLTRGTNTIVVQSGDTTAGILAGAFVIGEGIPAGTTVTGFTNGTTTLTLSQPVNASGVLPMTIINDSSARGGVALSQASFRSGSQSLRFYKSGAGAGSALTANIAVPVRPKRAAGFECFYRVAPVANGTGTYSVFANAFFANIQAADLLNSLPFVTQTASLTDQPIRAIEAAVGIPDWTRLAFGSTRVDLSTVAHDGYAPEWATHVLLRLSAPNSPNGFEMFLDDFHFNDF